jgi:hypothetical protein
MILRASFSFGFSIKVNRLHNNNTVILENASDFSRTRYKLDKIVFLSIFLKPESYLFLLTFLVAHKRLEGRIVSSPPFVAYGTK